MKKKNKNSLDIYDFEEMYFFCTIDRVDTISEQEKLVEGIEWELKNLIEAAEFEENHVKNDVSLKKYSLLLILGYLTIMSLIIIGVCLLGGYKTLIDTVFGTMMSGNFAISILTVIGIPLVGGAILQKYIGNKKDMRNKNVEYTVIKCLMERLEREKEKLEELREKYQKNKSKFRITYINHEKIDELLNDTFKLYYDCGYNGNKYYKYFKKGVLEKRLSKKYSKEELEEIKRYLVMNEERYVKKKTK